MSMVEPARQSDWDGVAACSATLSAYVGGVCVSMVEPARQSDWDGVAACSATLSAYVGGVCVYGRTGKAE